MIFISSLSFSYIILFILVYNGVQLFTRNKQILNWLLLFGSVLILNTITSLDSLAILVVVSGFVFRTGLSLSRNKKWKRLRLNLSIGLLITLFCVKNYDLANFDLLQRIGLSYILFRLIHFLIDSSKDKIHQYDIFSFLNYILFFPTFIAGPIDEYNNFNYWIKQQHNNYKFSLVKAGLFKLTLGIVKKFFLVPIIVSYSLDFSIFEQNFIWQEGLLYSLFLYSFYILLDFSGYSDIAIGTAYLIGIKTPENFNNPYGAKNLSVFWKKWHMTFSNFLFKYVFKPLVTKLSAQFSNLPRLAVSFTGYIITFILCGIWHGNTINFMYWGLWHGIGLIFFKLWDVYIYKPKIKPVENKVFKTLYSGGAIAITFTFVTVGWFFFNYQQGDIKIIAKNIVHKEDKDLNVSIVKYERLKCFQIDFEPDHKEDNLVDIEYTYLDRTMKYNNIPISLSNTYHLLTEGSGNQLVSIKIRSKSEGQTNPWHSKVTYSKNKAFKQTKIQSFLFGAYDKEIEEISSIDTLLGTDLYLTEEYLNQKLQTQSRFLDGYGWALQINYLAMEGYFLEVEYQFDGGEWISYTKKRDGAYNFMHLHGKNEYNNTSRNMAPGSYKVRLKYFKGKKSSKWFYGDVTVPNYVDS